MSIHEVAGIGVKKTRKVENIQASSDPLHRVVAYHVNDNDKAAAESILSVHENLPAFVIGLGTPAQIGDLRRQGIIVEDLGPTIDKSTQMHPADSISSYPALLRVKIWGPVTSARREKLQGDLLERISGGDYLFRVGTDQEVRTLWNLSFVDKISPYSG